MADLNIAHGAGTSSNFGHGAGTSSNFAHGGENVELEDDMEEDPTDILEAEVDDFLTMESTTPIVHVIPKTFCFLSTTCYDLSLFIRV
jgi:hypothetical protein